MVYAERFEDLLAWQKARKLANEVYKITRHGDLARDYGLKDQLQRSAVSVMSNIDEGFERGSKAEFHRFLLIAKASCGEVRSQIYIAYDVDYLDEATFQRLLKLAIETSRIISGLQKSVGKQR